MQFFINVFQMAADCVNAQLQLAGNLLVGIALAEVRQYLLLPDGEMDGFIPRPGFLPEGLDHAPGNLTGHGSAATQHVEQGGSQIRRLGSF